MTGNGDCTWTSIVTILVKEQCSALGDGDRKLIPDRVAKLKAQGSKLKLLTLR